MRANRRTRIQTRFPALVYAALFAAALAVALSGCAATSPEQFVEEPGVTVRVTTTEGREFSGTLIGMEEGVLVVDHSLPKSEGLTIVDRDGVGVALLHGVPLGRAVEVRDVDVVVRERLAFFEVEEVDVVTRAYFGWGTAIAAVLAFLLVKVLEDV
jgi:hypothetical protein